LEEPEKNDYLYPLSNVHQMKHLFSPFLPLLIVLPLLFSACTSPSDPDNSSSADAPEGMEMTKAVDEPVYPELSAAAAQKLVNSFDSIVTHDAQKEFVYGFGLNHGELKALYDDTDSLNQDTIYALVGYHAQGDSFGLVFCIEHPINSNSYRYFDFTQPCPKFCPNTPKPKDPPKVERLADHRGYWFGREGLDSVLSVSTSGNVDTYLMLYDVAGDWADELIFMECDTTNDCSQSWGFAYCGVAGAPPCHVIE
jgi:hypothetical protein